MVNTGLTTLHGWFVPEAMMRTGILCDQKAANLDICRLSHGIEQFQNWNINKYRRNILWKTA